MTPPDDPWHVLDQLDFSSPSISNPSLLAAELQDGSPTLLMVHLHARILYEVNHEELKVHALLQLHTRSDGIRTK